MTRKAAVSELLRQSDLFQTWGLLVPGGIVALLVTNKSHRSPWFEWPYMLLGPSAVLILTSLFSSWVVRKRFTYMVIHNNYESLKSISDLVAKQADLFLTALMVVSLFAAWFLVLITAGKIEPFEP